MSPLGLKYLFMVTTNTAGYVTEVNMITYCTFNVRELEELPHSALKVF